MPSSFAQLALLGALLAASANVNAQAPAAGGAAGDYPNMPTQFPSPDQVNPINGTLLEAPLIVEGMKKVRAAVPPRLLELPLSRHLALGQGAVEYPGGVPAATANCHWPNGFCVRDKEGEWGKPDVVRCPGENVWGITYDDGPTVNTLGQPDTSDIVSNLGQLNAKATFFVAGSASFYNPTELKATFDAGHEIAVHTWTHRPLTSLTNEQIVAEILYTEAWIYKTIGKKSVLFRPPFGDVDDRARAIISALGYSNILWGSNPDRDTHDAGPVTPEAKAAVVQKVKTWFTPQPGFISLEHDITSNTSDIAVSILKDIQTAGPSFPLKLQAVGQCLGVSAYSDGSSAGSSGPGKSGNGTNRAAGSGSGAMESLSRSSIAVAVAAVALVAGFAL